MPSTRSTSIASRSGHHSGRHSGRSSRVNQTTAYRQLWKGLTNNAIAPAVRCHLAKSKSHRGTRGSQKRHGGSGGGQSHVPFVHDWMQPMSAIVEARRKNGLRRRSMRQQQVHASSSRS